MSIKHILSLGALLLMSMCAFGQSKNESIWVIDYVKIKDGKKAETLYYYEQNWKRYREEALKRGYIKSYSILQALPDSLQNFDLMLITEFADSTQLSKVEEHFQPIIKSLNPDGPRLLNSLKPAEFRQTVFNKRFYQLAPTVQ